MATRDISCQHNITPPCSDSSYSTCPHCSLDLCLEHINEHQNLVRIEFNEVIDRINQQKSTFGDCSAINEMRAKALSDLNTWKMAKIEAIMSVYNAECIRVENNCDECITETSNIQNTAFEELYTASNTIEKKKNIHPRDITQLEQKLNEHNLAIEKIHEDTSAELNTIVTNIELPEIIHLRQCFDEAQEKVTTMTKEYQKAMDITSTKDHMIRMNQNTIQDLQRTITQKDDKIMRLKQNCQALSDRSRR